KPECGGEDMQQTVPADRIGICRRARRKTERRIGDEDAGADQTQAVARQQQWSPGATRTRVDCPPQADSTAVTSRPLMRKLAIWIQPSSPCASRLRSRRVMSEPGLT